ncbi:MAG TPA: HNH endonuclease signature motif containing protein, partial [Actinopolymorphaceae bacterium]
MAGGTSGGGGLGVGPGWVRVADLLREQAMLGRLADANRLGPGELNGFGPIPARVINQLARAADTGFSYCMSITDAGRVIFHNRLGYRPTTKTRRYLQAKDRTCRHPGCNQPASRCDLDHMVEHRHGGPTCPCNLTTLCRRHHTAKHQDHWWWTQPQPGTY